MLTLQERLEGYKSFSDLETVIQEIGECYERLAKLLLPSDSVSEQSIPYSWPVDNEDIKDEFNKLAKFVNLLNSYIEHIKDGKMPDNDRINAIKRIAVRAKIIVKKVNERYVSKDALKILGAEVCETIRKNNNQNYEEFKASLLEIDKLLGIDDFKQLLSVT